jgi:outer membrane protein TolC
MNLRISSLFSLLTITLSQAFGQLTMNTLTLYEVLDLARETSPQAVLAKHQFRAAYWEHRTYEAEFLPSLTLNGTFPEFNRSLVRYQKEDGTYVYIEENSNTTTLGLSLNQNIGLTGGRIFARSNLERTDLFGNNEGTNYMSVPVQIGFNQPIFGFNQLKWKKKVEPLKYLEAKQTFLESMENISAEAIRLFFDLILAQQNVRTAKLNYANTDTLYQIAKGRYNIGTIAENELLQMELSYLNAGSSVNEADIDLQLKKFRLKSFLGLNDQYDLELIVPIDFPRATLEYNEVLNLAQSNNPRMVQFQRNLIEADRNVAQAKADRGFNANLYATFGLTQRADELLNVYRDPMDQQGVRVGVTIPILDWGLGKGKVKMAESSREVVRTNIQQSIVDFEQDVFLKVMQFNLQDDQLMLAAKADTIAQSRYNVTKERFLIGRIDVLELNIAQTERDNARDRYIAAMRNYWQFYYNMRKLTLYDFINDKPIDVDFDKLIK